MTTADHTANGRLEAAAARAPRTGPDVSIVVPMLNEEENVAALWGEIAASMDASEYSWEAIFVDDGSRDRSVQRLREAAAGDERLTIIELARRFGQTAALAAGFRQARGRYIVPMDADLQNDPRDIPRMVSRLEDPPGFDVVSGWRRNRHDRLLSRRLPSVLANRLIAKLTWTRIHDFGCTLKAYRREALMGIELYGEMHRFLPALCKWRGARVTEMVVNHRPRIHGTSKYNLRRTFKVVLDLLTMKFLGDYLTKPIYFFGKLALLTAAAAFLCVGVAIAQRAGYMAPGGEPLNLNRNVLVLLAMMLGLMCVMFVMMGVLAELMVRIYHESQGKLPYVVRAPGHYANVRWPDRPAAGRDAPPAADAPARSMDDRIHRRVAEIAEKDHRPGADERRSRR